MKGWQRSARWAVLAHLVGLGIALLWVVNRGQGFSEPLPACTVQQPWMPPRPRRGAAAGRVALASQTPAAPAPPFTAPPPTPSIPMTRPPILGCRPSGRSRRTLPVPLVRLRSPRSRFGPAR